MYDAAVLALGSLGLILFTYTNIKDFKKVKSNPQYYNSNEKSASSLSQYIILFMMVTPSVMDSEYLRRCFYIGFCIWLLILLNTFRIIHYKLHKSSGGKVELILLNSVLVLFFIYNCYKLFIL